MGDEDRTRPDSATDQEAAGDLAAEAAVEVHLPDHLQNRNCAIFAACVSMVYLAAPVLYIGFVQAALCEKLGASDTISNLPSTAYMALAAFPVLIAWLVPQVRLLRPSITLSYAVAAVMGALVAAALALPTPNWLRIAAMVAHGAVLGCANGVTATFNWEVLGRGVAERKRGRAFTLAYGVGPMFAVLGSLGSQVVVKGELFGVRPEWLPQIPYPYNFAALFGASVPIMALAAFLARFYTIPLPQTELQRKPFASAVLKGFTQFFAYRLALVACIAYLLVYAGHMVQNNMSLYTREAMGVKAEDVVGYQMALRFSFKVLAGFIFGWLLTRTSPRALLLVTGLVDVASVVWGLAAMGKWFLLAFGINGAGELFGVYYPNYVLGCSPKSQMRRNMAFVSMITVPVAVAPVLFGWISDTWSLRASFWAAIAILLVALVLVALILPPRPRPRAEDLDASDLETESLPDGSGAAPVEQEPKT